MRAENVVTIMPILKSSDEMGKFSEKHNQSSLPFPPPKKNKVIRIAFYALKKISL